MNNRIVQGIMNGELGLSTACSKAVKGDVLFHDKAIDLGGSR
jgi:hypothetical protein